MPMVRRAKRQAAARAGALRLWAVKHRPLDLRHDWRTATMRKGGSIKIEGDEGRPLIQHEREDFPDHALTNGEGSEGAGRQLEQTPCGLNRQQQWSLYVSHFLSTWNTRTYEFAAILFFADLVPSTLLLTSIRGVIVNFATLCLSSTIGRWIDGCSSRLQPLRVTILLQRACIFAACMSWASVRASSRLLNRTHIAESNHECAIDDYGRFNWGFVVLIISLGVIESLCAVGNSLVMERDWVPSVSTPETRPSIFVLNAGMKRIDLISKLTAPVFVSTLQTLVGSTSVVAVALAVQNLASVVAEVVAVQRVWKCHPRLRMNRPTTSVMSRAQDAWLIDRLRCDMRLYFGSEIWIPSLSSALQSFSILSMSGLMTTYFIAIGYPLSMITTVRILGSVVELGPTFLVPWIMPILSQGTVDPLIPLAYIGLCGLVWQTLCLVPTAIALLSFQSANSNVGNLGGSLVVSATFFVFLTFSRFGAWTHNIIAQNIVQITVPVEHRLQFSGVEMAFVGAAEIGRWSCGVLWSEPRQIPGLGFVSLTTVGFCCALYGMWVVKTTKRTNIPAVGEIARRMVAAQAPSSSSSP